MATFNLPINDTEHASKAVRAAIDIVDLAASQTFDGQQLSVRVGIATGPVIAGNVGGDGRQSYSIYDNTVNLSARLEALNKEHGTQILLDANTVEQLHNIPVRKIGNISVSGFSELTTVFTPTAKTSAKSQG